MSLNQHRRILITGATGGLGLTVTQVFANAGYIVTATGRNTLHASRIESYGARFIEADLLQSAVVKKLCHQQDSVIHLAALSSSWDLPKAFQRINVDVTANLLIAAKNAGCRRFVYISSPSVYASMHDQLGLTEGDSPSNYQLNDYARTKLVAERMVLNATSNDFMTTAIRPRAIVGPDDMVLVPKIMEMVRRGILPLLRQGKALIELTDVRDVTHAIMLAEENIEAVNGKAINISGGSPIAIRELAVKLASVMKQNIYFVPLSMPVARLLAQMGEWKGRRNNYSKEPALTSYKLATLAYSQSFDLTYAREKLGFHPSHDALATFLSVAESRMK